MQKRSIFGKKINNVITSEDILGKNVIDVEGNVVGVTEKVLLDRSSLDFIGISIDKGITKRSVSIGKNYIKKITDHAVFLKIRIAYEIKGMFVFDKEGKTVGTVSFVELHGNKNKIKNIHVKTSAFSSLIGKNLIIPLNKIKNIGDNVILKVKIDSLIKKKK